MMRVEMLEEWGAHWWRASCDCGYFEDADTEDRAWELGSLHECESDA